MSNSKSVEKRDRQSIKRRTNNRVSRGKVRSAVKQLETAIEKNDANVKELFVAFVKIIDTAANKGLIHKNAVARKKSRMAKRVNLLAS